MKESVTIPYDIILRDISFWIWWYLMRNKKFPESEPMEFYSLERLLRFAETTGMITKKQGVELREMRDSEKMFSIQRPQSSELEHIQDRVRAILEEDVDE